MPTIGPDDARLPGPNAHTSVKDINELFANMKKSGSDEMYFNLTRERTPGKTFSAEAIDAIASNIKTFLVARVAAAWEAIGERVGDEAFDSTPGPSDMKIEVKLTIDGQTLTVPDDLFPWWSIVDGERRAGA